MRLKLIFGKESQVEEIVWTKDIQDFPNVIEYKGENYSWAMYDKNGDVWFDYTLYYSKVLPYDFNYKNKAMTLDDVRGFWRRSDCECGAEKLFGPKTGHSTWCPKWKKA